MLIKLKLAEMPSQSTVEFWNGFAMVASPSVNLICALSYVKNTYGLQLRNKI